MIAALAEPPSRDILAALDGVADWLEIRVDLTGELDPAKLRRSFRGGLLFTLRSRDRGGRALLDPESRRRMLAAAAASFDAVDLEHGRDDDPRTLREIPPQSRRLSWHGDACDERALRWRFEAMSRAPAALYLLAPSGHGASDALAPISLLRSLNRTDVTAYAVGAEASWTRLLAPRFGAAVVHACAAGGGEDGMAELDQLVGDYGFPEMPPIDTLYGIVGEESPRSLAPRVQNTAFRALDMRHAFVTFATSEFPSFWRELRRGLPPLGMKLGGLTVVSPHKEAALQAGEVATERARRAGAANFLSNGAGPWRADTTTGIVEPLRLAGMDPAKRTAVVVGCGGAGRSVAYELTQAGAEVTLVNRGTERARFASELLGLPWVSLARFSPSSAQIVVNATPVAEELLFDVDELSGGSVVADLCYRQGEDTALVAAARARGCRTVDGRKVLEIELGRQFESISGRPLPPEAVRVALGDDDRSVSAPDS